MTSAFIIFAPKDRAIAMQLAAGLKQKGVESVWDSSLSALWWWEKYISLGALHEKLRWKQLDDSDGAIIIWSENALKSSLVVSQATNAMLADKLVQVKLDNFNNSNVPRPFKILPTNGLNDLDQTVKTLKNLRTTPLWSVILNRLIILFGLIGIVYTLLSSLQWFTYNTSLGWVLANLSYYKDETFNFLKLGDKAGFFLQLYESFLLYLFIIFSTAGIRIFQTHSVFSTVISLYRGTQLIFLFCFPIYATVVTFFLVTKLQEDIIYSLAVIFVWCLLYVLCVELTSTCKKLTAHTHKAFYDFAAITFLMFLYAVVLMGNEFKYGYIWHDLRDEDGKFVYSLENYGKVFILFFWYGCLLQASYFIFSQIPQKDLGRRLIYVIIAITFSTIVTLSF